jgi:uncharacterized protein YkwD
VTRLRKLLATAAPVLLCAGLAMPAGAAPRASSPLGETASRPAVHAHSATRRATRRCVRHRVRGGRRSRTVCRTVARHPASRAHRVAPANGVTASATTVAADQAQTIAKVLATPCQNTQLLPQASNLALVRAAVLCLVNTERAEHGREPLQGDPHLEAAAESHGKEMLALNYFDHIAPSGLTPVERIRQNGYIPSSEVGYVIGENLAWGTLTLATPEAIVDAWIASPEHLANILEGRYRDTGIDVEPQVPSSLAEGVEGALYTQEFGVVVH